MGILICMCSRPHRVIDAAAADSTFWTVWIFVCMFARRQMQMWLDRQLFWFPKLPRPSNKSEKDLKLLIKYNY